MDTNLIVLFVLVFLIAILIAIKISSEENDSNQSIQSVDELICQGDLVEFVQEFDDGFYVFYLGERVWVTEFVDYGHVVVSNKHDGYCATDGAEPFKFCTVPISILKKVTKRINNLKNQENESKTLCSTRWASRWNRRNHKGNWQW